MFKNWRNNFFNFFSFFFVWFELIFGLFQGGRILVVVIVYFEVKFVFQCQRGECGFLGYWDWFQWWLFVGFFCSKKCV